MNTQMNMNAINKGAEAIIKSILEQDKRRAELGIGKPTQTRSLPSRRSAKSVEFRWMKVE